MNTNPATLGGVPRFEPFRAERFSLADPVDIAPLVSPPYDVFGLDERARLADSHRLNIVRIDYPVESDGAGRYEQCADTLRSWRESGDVTLDDSPSLSLYRMSFRDDTGRSRETVGVVGALEVVDEGAPGVLPHERTTPKAKSDRLDLLRATAANLSPVWGLSLASGLSALLTEPAETMATVTDAAGVLHRIERVTDRDRLAAISAMVSAQPVLIADGHHRYAVSRTYRDSERSHGDRSGAELTMTYVAELVAEQLSIAAIHRLVTGHDADTVLAQLSAFYDPHPIGRVNQSVLARMESSGGICLVDRDLEGTLLIPRGGAFDSIRDLDSARLEHALGPLISAVSYQHGVGEVIESLEHGIADCAVLIRPVSLDEIRHTAETGELMAPKSTFFTPKLLTGLLWRPLAAR